MSAGITINIPLRVHVRGVITLGPKPGTPAFELEQAAKSRGEAFDYEKHGTKLYLKDEDPEQPTQRSPILAMECDIPPSEGQAG